MKSISDTSKLQIIITVPLTLVFRRRLTVFRFFMHKIVPEEIVRAEEQTILMILSMLCEQNPHRQSNKNVF